MIFRTVLAVLWLQVVVVVVVLNVISLFVHTYMHIEGDYFIYQLCICLYD